MRERNRGFANIKPKVFLNNNVFEFSYVTNSMDEYWTLCRNVHQKAEDQFPAS